MSQTKSIECLTPEQAKYLPVFRKHWFDVGTCTEPADRPKAEAAITGLYAAIGKDKPVFFWFDGLMTSELFLNLGANLWDNLGANLGDNLRDNLGANLGASLRDSLWDNLRDNLRDNLGANLRASLGASLRANLGDNLGDNLWDNLWANLGASLRANLWANLGANLRDNLGDNLRDNLGVSLRDNLWANLWANLGANLRDNLWANLRDSLRANKLNFVPTSMWAQMDSGWIALFLFCAEIGVPFEENDKKILNLWAESAKSSCWWWPHENICVISERPSEIQMVPIPGQDFRFHLHRDGGPSVRCRDGWAMWNLNGARVPQIVAETPTADLDPRLILSEKNAEVRRELVRKVGVDRVYSTLGGKELDTWGNYSLITLDLQDGRHRPYLKMLNPSIGTWHIEGVHTDCKTVLDALSWRNGTRETPVVVT